MFSFYWSMVRDIPGVLRSKTEAWLFWVWTIGASTVVYFSPELKAKLDTPQVSRWFVAIPIAASVAYGMLRVNYERFKKLERELKEVSGLVRDRTAHGAVRTALGNMCGEFLRLQNKCVTGEGTLQELQAELHKLSESSYVFVQQFFDGGEAALLNRVKFPELDPNALALLQHNPELTKVYTEAQYRAEAIQKLIENIRLKP